MMKKTENEFLIERGVNLLHYTMINHENGQVSLINTLSIYMPLFFRVATLHANRLSDVLSEKRLQNRFGE